MFKILVILLVLTLFSTVFAQKQNDNAANAKLFLEAMSKKDFANAYNYFSYEAKSQLPFEAMPQILAQITSAYGEFRSVKETKKTPDGKNVLLIIEFEKETTNIGFSFNDAGKIVGFKIIPPENTPKYETPSYAKPDSFIEKEVTVGTGEWALPATLTMPKGKTNVPAIILVHGSGPQDRDETGVNRANKMFKDLAWGLASKGIAVLRYDKRTLVYGQKVVALKNFTVNEETVDDAIVAVELLRKTPNIDAKNIFVAGHSLGGMLIPRIGQRDKNIAGLISLAGLTRKFEDTYAEQIEYLSGLDGNISKEEQTEIDKLKKQAVAIKKLKLTDPPDTQTMLNLPVSYWVELNNYNPVVVAKTLKQPLLILQGESDYNVTMVNFAAWKGALRTKKNAEFKSYPKLYHAFMEGLGGKPSPQDEEKTNHVEEVVITDIANWILKTVKK